MRIVLLRTSSGEESTLGQLYIDGEPVCFTLEDQYQPTKVKGETRIPDGVYEIGLREEISPLTTKYRARHVFFTYHLLIKDVKGFNYVYIHIGNTDENTDGCILVGDSLVNNRAEVNGKKDGFLGNSTQAFERIYKPIRDMITLGDEKVEIEIRTFKP